MFGNRALYHNGWIACCFHGRAPWETSKSLGFDKEEKWELYNVAEDFSQANDLATQEPQRLRQLQNLWWTEAGKYNVLPLDDRTAERIDASMRPDPMHGRNSISYGHGAVLVQEPSSPNTKNKSYSITVEAEIPPQGADGMLVTCGGGAGGYAFFVEDGKLTWDYNYFGEEHFRVQSPDPIPPGKATLKYDFKSDGGRPGSGGTGTLFINGKKVGEHKQPKSIPFRFGTGTMNVGEVNGSPVVERHPGPFRFNGKIERVDFDLAPKAVSTKEREEERKAQFSAAMKAA
jgi:arylsulfatase